MGCDVERYRQQARTKMRIIGAREMRQFERGEIGYIPGMLLFREMDEAVKIAYAAGRRDERAAISK